MEKKQSIIVKISLAMALVVSGVLWLIGGLVEEFNFGFLTFLPVLSIGISIAFLLTGIFEKSVGYMFLFTLFFVNGLIYLVGYYLPENQYLNAGGIWPVSIASIGFGAIFLATGKETNTSFHLKSAALFLIVATLLYLGNQKILNWYIVLASIVVTIGLLIVVNVITNKCKKEQDEIAAKSLDEFEANEGSYNKE